MPVLDIPYAPAAAQQDPSQPTTRSVDVDVDDLKDHAELVHVPLHDSEDSHPSLTHVQRWRALLQAPRELLVVYIVKLLFSYAHFSTAICLTLWLSAELGLSDVNAGLAYGFCGLSTTVWGLVGGVAVDRVGIRPAVLVGTIFATIARVALSVAPGKFTAILALTVLMPLADALGIPVLTIGVKRCTGKHNAGLGFSLFYVFQNIAALVAGLAVDAVRGRLGGEHGVMYVWGKRYSYHEVVFLSGAMATFACFAIVLLGLQNIEKARGAIVQDGEPRVGLVETVRRVLREESFWRFSKLAFILLGVSMIYRHLDATLPKYMVRVFGSHAPYGAYYALEPLLVIFAVPIAGTFITCMPLYTTLILGTTIAALSPFWLSIADKYMFVALFVITLSIGESIYSPRVYQYTMAVSSVGSEGVYTALGNAPLFAVNVVAGGMSGFLLDRFVPNAKKLANGAVMRPQYMWAIIGISCLTSPVLMALFRKNVEEPEVAEDVELEEFFSIQDEDPSSQ